MFKRLPGLRAVCSIALLLAPFASVAGGAQDEAGRERFAELVEQLLNAVEVHHIQPPPVRKLVIGGVDHLGESMAVDASAWAERFPEQADAQQVHAFLLDLYDEAARHAELEVIVNTMVRGISRSVPGGARALNAADAEVADSLAGNRYVGVGVVLDFKQGLPVILDTYFGGPAHRAGILPGDIVYEVNGVDAAGLSAAKFIEYSRDEIGTELVYVVGRPGSTERRRVGLIRDVVPRETVLGTQRGTDERWSFALPSTSTAYVKLTAIDASTAHELRLASERIERDGLGAVVLDLRAVYSKHMHATALVADLFRRDALMGTSETRAGRTEYRAGPEALFDAARVVVLVDETTRSSTEWLAKVLRQGGARIVGRPTPGIPFLLERVKVQGWPAEVELATGWILEPSADGDRAPLRGVRPDRVEADSERCLEVALAMLAEETSR